MGREKKEGLLQEEKEVTWSAGKFSEGLSQMQQRTSELNQLLSLSDFFLFSTYFLWVNKAFFEIITRVVFINISDATFEIQISYPKELRFCPHTFSIRFWFWKKNSSSFPMFKTEWVFFNTIQRPLFLWWPGTLTFSFAICKFSCFCSGTHLFLLFLLQKMCF